jgi:hypothetical protein
MYDIEHNDLVDAIAEVLRMATGAEVERVANMIGIDVKYLEDGNYNLDRG